MTNLQAMDVQENAKNSGIHPLARCVCLYTDIPLFCMDSGHWRASCTCKQGMSFFMFGYISSNNIKREIKLKCLA